MAKVQELWQKISMLSTDKNISTSSKDTNGNYINCESRNSKNRKNNYKTLHFPCFARVPAI